MKKRSLASSVSAVLGLVAGVALLASVVTLVRAPAAESRTDASATAAGASATLLPDGRWLLLGGERGHRVRATAVLTDPRTGTTTVLPAGLGIARAWHTATVLPDGTVLVLGGLG